MTTEKVLIHTRLLVTEAEWVQVRQLALSKGVSTATLVGDAVRHSLLKGAKP